MRPLFSVITPVFDGVARIKPTVDSVISQREADWEYLVIDGGSTDGTVDCLREYGDRLRWISEPDRGIYDAMNKGIEMATGRFLYFIGAGDTLSPGALAQVAEQIEQVQALADSSPWFLYGDVTWGTTGRRYAGPFSKLKLTRQNICHQAIFLDARIFERLGKFDLRYPVLSDHHFNFRCFGDAGIRSRYMDLVVANYEADGISERLLDPEFRRDYSKVISQTLGWRYRVAHAYVVRLERSQNIAGTVRARLRHLLRRVPRGTP